MVTEEDQKILKCEELKRRNEKILNSIPEECELTLEHVEVHLDSAREMEYADTEQYTHDLDLAGRILLAMVYKRDLEEGRYN